jgi:uncharacterized protein YbaP (TraB family)
VTITRRTSEGLQVPIETWVNDDGNEVILSGAMHVAGADFFRKIRADIALYSQKGYEIHIEGIRKPVEGESMSDREIEIRALALEDGEQRIMMADILGLDNQKNGLVDEYIKFGAKDSSFKEMAEAVDLEKYRKTKELTPRLKKLRSSTIRRKLFASLMLMALQHIEYVRSVVPVDSFHLPESFIIERRNQIAFDYVMNSSKTKHYVFWGAAHLEGLGELFTAAGYRKVSTDWQTVIPKGHKAPWRLKGSHVPA